MMAACSRHPSASESHNFCMQPHIFTHCALQLAGSTSYYDLTDFVIRSTSLLAHYSEHTSLLCSAWAYCMQDHP